MKYLTKIGILLLLIPMLLFSCNKFLDVQPSKKTVNALQVYRDGTTAATALQSNYSSMVINRFSSSRTSTLAGLSGDELLNPQLEVRDIYLNNISVYNQTVQDYWAAAYNIIYNVNALYEGCRTSDTQKPEEKKQLMGEALFTRAFCYFYLVNFFGDVPLPLTSEAKTNVQLERQPVSAVYTQMDKDLLEARDSLNEFYVGTDGQQSINARVRPNRFAARALLARVYLYQEKWNEAQKEATAVIQASQLYQLVPLDRVFLQNSREAIFQLMPPANLPFGSNTMEATEYVPFYQKDTSARLNLSNELLQAFEPTDLRLKSWVGDTGHPVSNEQVYFAYKYKKGKAEDGADEYTMVLRLSEQYLIRAEANIHLGHYGAALQDLNVVRNRAGLPCLMEGDFVNNERLLEAVLHERQVELFTEWGHRWFDLKRMKKLETVMGRVIQRKETSWNGGSDLYPIPDHDRQLNNNLTQNPGY